MSKLNKLALMGLLLLLGVQGALAGGNVDSARAVSAADSVIVNGWYINDSTEADELGEMSCELTAAGFPSVWTGIPESLLTGADTVQIGSCWAFSSLEMLNVPDDTTMNTSYDTIYFKYAIQNQGNVTDSFYVVASIRDTNNLGFFTPVAFNFIKDTAAVTDSILGLGFDTSKVDSAYYGFSLAQEAFDSFYVRIVMPGPGNAADGDSCHFDLKAYGHYASGVNDNWPGDTLATGAPWRTVLDTHSTKILWHTHGDTVWEYGDTQRVDNYLTVNAPVLRLAKYVDMTGNLPGDTLTYSILYDNDGTAWTEDTVNIVDKLPRGLVFLEIDTLGIDHDTLNGVRLPTDNIDVDYIVNADSVWLETEPGTPESLLMVTKLRFQIPAGIGLHAGADDPDNLIADNNDSSTTDGGVIRFKVRIR